MVTWPRSGSTLSAWRRKVLMFGPNTNSITNTIVFSLERQAAYIRQAIEFKADRGIIAMEIRNDLYREFQDWLQCSLDKTVFTDNCPGWYTNADGKVIAMWPKSHLEYYWATRRFRPAQYQLTTTASSTPDNRLTVSTDHPPRQ
ncbi:hypothetical protein [Nocardia carnea]|uniref:hypothetical protein n=1 Tax=Nocardia carnea TaxID=37328 RepID=UPI002453946B|nr:hypothetical protein [Nocardia carnea]